MQTCLPNSLDGRAYANGCFLRYSTTSFFPDNQTIEISPSLKQGTQRFRPFTLDDKYWKDYFVNFNHHVCLLVVGRFSLKEYWIIPTLYYVKVLINIE